LGVRTAGQHSVRPQYREKSQLVGSWEHPVEDSDKAAKLAAHMISSWSCQKAYDTVVAITEHLCLEDSAAHCHSEGADGKIREF